MSSGEEGEGVVARMGVEGGEAVVEAAEVKGGDAKIFLLKDGMGGEEEFNSCMRGVALF